MGERGQTGNFSQLSYASARQAGGTTTTTLQALPLSHVRRGFLGAALANPAAEITLVKVPLRRRQPNRHTASHAHYFT